ncbi:type II secretion system protein [Massilia niastensis]|uniref:type II secretion system protein n=1 Tax=Massilia niastensis TaxID=544911 RepID=UPI0003718E07|nr:type II secretion system protein [Massilia niastensis]
MNKSFTKGAQGGFTLIELIVVIVILGILAATALPKFASLGGDARVASLQAARGALNATAAMIHGQALINPSADTITVEGVVVNLTNGYPSAEDALATAAGLNAADYQITSTNTTVTIRPVSVVGNTALQNSCFIRYREAAAGQAPTYELPAGGTLTCE